VWAVERSLKRDVHCASKSLTLFMLEGKGEANRRDNNGEGFSLGGENKSDGTREEDFVAFIRGRKARRMEKERES